jgi:multicomponent Na+:H+ antiporter subunit D
MGLGLFTPLALAGAVFYTAHHIIAKTNLFLVSGMVERLGGTPELKKLGGLYRAQPILALLFLVPAMSLVGIPPLSGFFAKLSLVRAGLETEQYVLVAIALGVSILTLFSMLKLWTEAFWKPAPEDSGVKATLGANLQGWLFPIVFLAVITVLIGIGAGPLFRFALQAGEQLMNPSIYIQAVMGGVP